MWVTGVRHFETTRFPRNVGHQLHSGEAPHFRRTETLLNVIIRELHCHVGEMKKCAKCLSEIHKGKSSQWKPKYGWVHNIIKDMY